MAKMIFNIDKTDYREAFNIELSVPDDMNIFEFKTVCVRMASAMGYTDLSIKKAFGSTEYETKDDVEFKKFINAVLGVHSGSLQTI
jgi:hypothetical protein